MVGSEQRKHLNPSKFFLSKSKYSNFKEELFILAIHLQSLKIISNYNRSDATHVSQIKAVNKDNCVTDLSYFKSN